MAAHSVYTLPPPHFVSGRWNRIAGRVLTRKEQLRLQAIALLFIFLLLSGPIYWIHPPSIRAPTLAPLIPPAPIIPLVEGRRLPADWLSMQKGQISDSLVLRRVHDHQQREQAIGRPIVQSEISYLHIAMKLYPEVGSRTRGRNKFARQSYNKFIAALSQASLIPSAELGSVDITHIAKARVVSGVLFGDEWGGRRTVPLELSDTNDVKYVQSTCLGRRGAAVCCELAGEMEYLLQRYRYDAQLKKPLGSILCIHHAQSTLSEADQPSQDCGGPTLAASLTAALALGVPGNALASSTPSFVAHAHCGPLLVRQLGAAEERWLSEYGTFPGFSYCVNSAFLSALQQKLSGMHSNAKPHLRTGCSFLKSWGLGTEEMKKLDPVQFASKVLGALS